MSQLRRCLALFCLSIAMAWGCAASRTDSGGAARERVLRPCPSSPNCVTTESGGDLPAFRLAQPAQAAWPRVRKSIAALTRCHIADESPTYLRAECTSLLFRFVDDLEIELRAATATLAVRSASRTGYSDLGVNRRRVEQLRAILSERGVLLD